MFVDFEKAFDFVNNQILLDKLEHYGVRGIARSLFCSYLSNGSQYTVNTEEQFVSEQLPKLIGVPQGAQAIFISSNDLLNCCDSKIVLYADVMR